MDQKEKRLTDGNTSIKNTEINNNIIQDLLFFFCLDYILKQFKTPSTQSRMNSKDKETNQHSPDPLAGQTSGTEPLAQQWPDSQQHCLLVILPASSWAQRPLAVLEKQLPALWSGSQVKNKKPKIVTWMPLWFYPSLFCIFSVFLFMCTCRFLASCCSLVSTFFQGE